MDDFTAMARSQVRVGDAERDRAAAALGEHFGAGRLDRAEFDARMASALAARTEADLAALFTDLPRGAPAEPEPARAALWPPPRPRGYLPMAVIPVALVLAVVAAVHGIPPFFLIPLFWLTRAGRRGRFRPRPR